ncbi:putative secreted protein [Wickerhamomyces ciferrii]|uniref:Secreted protein n=1 Tax=Wickerhamomyces ciferrii (strain ATCC 14091 / BCRC 22168 / CBS 111 / JCM 3599 / NBRC 0793 / NRRL Y-1031 F-60-10) TaxID=1206466 RepID=K0KWQ2_WICCF|nr:uncharacterized protein BN7_5511 [Wickerhamomyces ciferrii]CCH45924.1 putative secreted protein [Wickerhamomyces ciferrii]
MLFIRSLAALALLSLANAGPVPAPKAEDSNTFSYDVVNVDGSNARPTLYVRDDGEESANVVTGTTTVQNPTTTFTYEYTTTTTTTIPGKHRTVWLTQTRGQGPPTTPTDTATQDAQGSQDAASSTLQNTVIDGTTYLVSAYVSTIRPDSTQTYESQYTSEVASTGVSTISTSAPSPTQQEQGDQSSSAASSSITAAPDAAASSAAPEGSSSSETAYTTVSSDGVCEVYWDDIDYVSGDDASSATTTVTSTIYTTQTLN